MKRFAAFVDSETDENIWETVEDAYVYAFPLVLMDATETSATNTEEVVTKKAPVISLCTVLHWQMHNSGLW